jgi:chemotaxis protein MotA
MDLASLIGLILSFAMILFGIISGGSGITIFIDIPSLFIVFGGTIGVTVIKFKLATVAKTFIIGLKAAFLDASESPKELIDISIDIAKIVQKDGILALESYTVKNQFFAKGIGLIVDGHDPAFIKKILASEMKKTIGDSETGVAMFTGIGESGPAFGMIGTLIGLVQMLYNMSDPSSIGPAMAVALLTTMYGSIIANVFALPLADKLGRNLEQHKATMDLILQSIGAITQGLSPRVMTEMLETYLPESERTGGDS